MEVVVSQCTFAVCPFVVCAFAVEVLRGVECDSGGVFHDHVLVYRRVVTGAGECACVVCQWCARSTECMPVVRF